MTTLSAIDKSLNEKLSHFNQDYLEIVSTVIKYEDYIKREAENAQKIKGLENLIIEGKLNYDQIPALSNEARHKLKDLKPRTLGQASRISGVSPADVSILSVYLGR